MRRWAEILTTLVLFAIVMTAIGWALGATVPAGIDWLWGRIGGGAVWGILLTVWLAAGAYAWHGHRPKAGKAGKAAGR